MSIIFWSINVIGKNICITTKKFKKISERLYFYQQNDNQSQVLTVALLDLEDYNLISLLWELE